MSNPWLLGIEIGGTKLQLGVGDGRGSILALERLAVVPASGATGILEQIRAAVPTLLAKANVPRADLQAVGIGFGGPVDSVNGRTQKSFQVMGWDNFPLAEWVRSQLDVPHVVLENDSDSAGLAEARFGAGVGLSPVLYMNIGSGIGGALVVDDRVYRGFGQGALEIGHLKVPYGDGSGTQVELEQLASGWAIASAAQDLARRKIEGRDDRWPLLERVHGTVTRITAAMVAECASDGDPDSLRILDRARSAVAFALTQAITLLAPRRIVLGGGVSLVGERLWFEPIRTQLDQNAFGPFRGQFDVVPAALGEEVVVHGALALARDAANCSAPT